MPQLHLRYRVLALIGALALAIGVAMTVLPAAGQTPSPAPAGTETPAAGTGTPSATASATASPTATATPSPTPTPVTVYAGQLSAAGPLEVPTETAPTLETCSTEARPLWFSYTPWFNPDSSPYKDFVLRSLDQYHANGLSYLPQLAPYDPAGDFLNWGVFRTYNEGTELRFDAAGLPTINVNSDGVYHYHPTTMAQYALTLYGRALAGDGDLTEFLRVADFLLTMQDSRGAFRLEFPFYYYRMGRSLSPGWTSSLTQAQAMSVFARAYRATGDERFRVAGDRALAFLVTPSNQGGTLTSLAGVHRELGDYAFFKTFPSIPTAYTLNGFMLTMLGIYDWWQLDPEAPTGASAAAGRWFDCSRASLALILPLYDLGGFSAYDLGHLLFGGQPNAQPGYHVIHIALLHALATVTVDPRLEQVETRWRNYVDIGAPFEE